MPKRNFRRWTADDIAKLKDLAHKERLSAIATTLNRSSGAIAVKAHELGISLRFRPDRNADKASPTTVQLAE
jgi:hypothetical protein